jgi:hypothetical protein
VGFRKEFAEIYREIRHNPEFGACRRSKYYRAVADLRPLGVDAILHLEQKRYGSHKVELLDSGKKGMTQLESMLDQIVDHNPASLRIGRLDLATDVPDVALSWFREHVFIQYKQFLCSHGKLSDGEFSEMGKKIYQTLYFGKRPCCIRIYDKVAERLAEFELWKKRQTRDAKREWRDQISQMNPDQRPPLLLPELPSVTQWLSGELPDLSFAQAELPGMEEPRQLRFPVVTRVENQLGGRVPEQLRTIAEMKDRVADFNPFARLKVINGGSIPPGLFDRVASSGGYRFGVKEWMAAMFVHQNWNLIGGSEMRRMLNRDRNGNRYLGEMQEFIPVENVPGVTSNELYERYRESVSRQLAA